MPEPITHQTHYQRKPDWLKIILPSTQNYSFIKEYLSQFGLHTICESGKCPNIAECWAAKTATFMILGDTCTRNCRFCGVKKGIPVSPDPDEPEKIAKVISQIGLKHCVITSVTRDDLADGGAKAWHNTIVCIRKMNPGITIEALIPDFGGKLEPLKHIIAAKPDIISHNLETVSRLTPEIRIKAQYDISLKVIKTIADSGIQAKSGIMLGLGETKKEVLETLNDLLKQNCKIVTIGQYLQPSRNNFPVVKYYSLEEFRDFKEIGLTKGFNTVESGPLVRSSYHAEKHVRNLPLTEKRLPLTDLSF
ncbi:MAG: lipoyl synthase [Bacteroidota bacterium]